MPRSISMHVQYRLENRRADESVYGRGARAFARDPIVLCMCFPCVPVALVDTHFGYNKERLCHSHQYLFRLLTRRRRYIAADGT